jgi:parallel beta-helix repeat protein
MRAAHHTIGIRTLRTIIFGGMWTNAQGYRSEKAISCAGCCHSEGWKARMMGFEACGVGIAKIFSAARWVVLSPNQCLVAHFQPSCVFVGLVIVYNSDVSINRITASVLLVSFGVMMDCSLAANAYYVATTGSDTNTGLSTNDAFATLQHAADTVNAGDSVIVLAGRYVGARIERSGTPDHPITFRPQVGARVVLDTKSPAEKRDGIIEVETFSGNGIVSHVVVEGFEVVGAERYGVDVRSTQFVTIRGLTVSNATVSGIFTPFSHDITIENNTCAYNGEHGIYHNNSADRFIIRGNHLFKNTFAGLHMNGDISVAPPDGLPWVWDGLLSDGIVENNLIHENGTGGAGINMDGVVRTIIRNNVLYATPNNSGIAVFGIDGALASQQNMILNNVVLMALNSGWCLNIGHGAMSVLQVSSVATTNTSVILTWDSVHGRKYTIHEGRNPATFTPSDTNIEATPPINVYTTSPTNSATRFYRLGVTQSP